MTDFEFKTINRKLTEQSKNISKQYRELHKKFDHFEKGDLKKYQEIREMNLSEIKVLKEKIITCDQIITSQILGFLIDPNNQNNNENIEQTLHEIDVVHKKDDKDCLKSEMSINGGETIGNFN